MKKSRLLIAVIIPSLAFSMRVPNRDVRAQLARATKAEIARQKQEQDARVKATQERAAQAHDAQIKKAHQETIAKHIGAAKRKVRAEQLAKEQQARLAPKIKEVRDLQENVRHNLQLISWPMSSPESYTNFANRVYDAMISLFNMPRAIVNEAMRSEMRRQIAGMDFRNLTTELQKKFNDLVRRLGGSPKELVAPEEDVNRLLRYQKELKNDVQLLEVINSSDPGYEDHLSVVGLKASVLLNSKSAVVDHQAILALLQGIDFSRLPETKQKYINDLLEKHGGIAKDIITPQRQKELKEEYQKKHQAEIKKQEEAANLVPLKDPQGRAFGEKEAVVDIRDEDVITSEIFKDTIAEKKAAKKPFILARVHSGDKGKFIHYYEVTGIHEWMNRKLEDPQNRQKISNIHYFLYKPEKHIFEYIGDTALRSYTGNDEVERTKRKYLEDMIKASK